MEIDKLLEKYQISPRELHERTIEDSIGWWRMIVPVAFTKKVIDENEFVAWWGIGEDKKTNLERRLKILIERDSYMSAHLEDDVIPDEMKEVICKMISAGYMFAMDRDRLRDAIEDFSFMCQPSDDVNKDRIMKSLEYEDEMSDDESEIEFPIAKESVVDSDECCRGSNLECERESEQCEDQVEDIGNCSDK